MDDCLCASIGSVAVSAALEMRGWLALRVEVSNWGVAGWFLWQVI